MYSRDDHNLTHNWDRMKKLIYIAVLTLATAGAQMLPAVALADKPRFSGPDDKGHAQRYEAQRAERQSARSQERRAERSRAPSQREYSRYDERGQSNRGAGKLAPMRFDTPHADSFMREAPRGDRGGYGPSQRERGGDRPRVSLDQAVSKVRSQYGGKVIRAETRNVDGRSMHYVKILSAEGRVRTVRVDGRTGRIQ